MNFLIILGLAVVLLVYLSFRWNNVRTKLAFLFILAGILFLLFMGYLIVTGSEFDFSSVGSAVSSLRVYFIWLKGLAINVFEVTGRAIGFDI